MKRLYVAGGIIGLLVAIVIADYFAVFGTRTKSRFDFYELTFKPVDEETGAPVIGVHIRCFQKNNENACTLKNSGKAGILSVNIPVTKVITHTWLFEKDVTIQKTRDPKVHIMFIHQDYARPVETVLIQSLPELAQEQIRVTMPRHILFSK